jgi:hypothetical protein
MTKRYGPPRASDEVAALLRSRGINVDPLRLEEHLAAERSREKANFDAYQDRVRALARGVWRARRACELAEFDWRHSPGQDALRDAMAAQRARTDAEQMLRDELLGDDDLYVRVLRECRP